MEKKTEIENEKIKTKVDTMKRTPKYNRNWNYKKIELKLTRKNKTKIENRK